MVLIPIQPNKLTSTNSMQSYKEDLERQTPDAVYIEKRKAVESIMKEAFGAPVETIGGAQEHQVETINRLNEVREGKEEVVTAQ